MSTSECQTCGRQITPAPPPDAKPFAPSTCCKPCGGTANLVEPVTSTRDPWE